MIAIHLVDMLDHAGYVAANFADIAQTLGCTPKRIEETSPEPRLEASADAAK